MSICSLDSLVSEKFGTNIKQNQISCSTVTPPMLFRDLCPIENISVKIVTAQYL